jgi:hypothetical protein
MKLTRNIMIGMIGKAFKIIVQLYASFLSGIRTGRAVSAGSLKIDDRTALDVSRTRGFESRHAQSGLHDTENFGAGADSRNQIRIMNYELPG